jgi:hypothetical protein
MPQRIHPQMKDGCGVLRVGLDGHDEGSLGGPEAESGFEATYPSSITKGARLLAL